MNKLTPTVLSTAIVMVLFGNFAYATDYNATLTGSNITLVDGDRVIYDDKDAGVNIVGINSAQGLTVNGSAAIDLNTGGNGSAVAMQIGSNGTYNLGTDSAINMMSSGGTVFAFNGSSNASIAAEGLNVNFTNTDASNQANFFHNFGGSNLITSLNGSNITLTNVNFVDMAGSNNVLDLGNNTTINSTIGADSDSVYSSRTIFYVNGNLNTIKANNASINMDILAPEDTGGLINLRGSNNTIDLGTGSTLSINTNITDQQTTGIIVSGTGNTVLVKDANINLNVQQNSTAIGTYGTNAEVSLSGKMNIVGQIEASGQASNITLDATSGSNFTGASTANAGTFDFTMANSIWNMTDNSQVSNLTLNNSTVKFNNHNFETLTTDSLQGNGLFDIRTDIVGQQGDLIVVNGIAEGNHQLKVTNNGSATTDGTETLTVVQTGTGSTAKFGLANNVELGGYQYGLRETQASATNFELYSTGKVTSTAQAATSFLNIAYLTTYIENQTLLQRLGDLRNSEAAGVKSDGFWMKGFGGKLSAFSSSTMKGFDMTYTGTQLGIDKNIDIQDGRLLVGVMAGFTRTNPNYREGDGTGKNYTAGVYATYLNDNGIYIDNVLKYNSMHNQFNVKDTVGNAVKGTGKTQGIMLSTEVGKRFWLESKQQGFYLEPQAQLSYGYQNGDTVHASNGLKVGLSHYNSTLGRVGGIAGYQIQGKTPINIYVKTGVVREMSGGASYRFNNGEKNSHTFRSSWFDNGIGANVTINKQHNIYAEADYSTGGKFDNAMMNIGYRYSF